MSWVFPNPETEKEWMAAHSAAIMAVFLLVLGARPLGDAIAGLG
jgi:hypothetical protein